MRGHIRRRGERSYEYIVDVGIAEAQRCRSCGRRFWLERKPRERCPKCGGELAETEERRRAIKGGFTTRRECEAALAKILASLEAQTFTPPTKVTVKQFLLQRVAAHREGQPAPDHLRLVCHAHPRAHPAASRRPAAAEAHAGRDQRPLRRAFRERPRARRGRPLGLLGAPRARRAAQGLQGRGALGAPGEQPGRLRRSAQDQWRRPRRSCASGTPSSWPRSSPRWQDDRLFALWRLLAATGMRRGEALGLAWQDLDMEEGAVTIRRAWIPVNGVAQFCRAQESPQPAHDRLGPGDSRGLAGSRRPPGRRAG